MNEPRNEQTAHEVVIERRQQSSLFVGLLVCSLCPWWCGGGRGGVSECSF